MRLPFYCAKDQPRAVSRALLYRWQHAAIHLCVHIHCITSMSHAIIYILTRVKASRLTLPYLTLPYLTLPYLTSPYLTSPLSRFTLSRFASHAASRTQATCFCSVRTSSRRLSFPPFRAHAYTYFFVT